MKQIVKILTLCIFVLSSVNASGLKEMKTLSLKKDEQKQILVKYDGKERLFEFRWTLFVNGGLVVHRSYDTIVSQNILYLRNRNQSFTLKLFPHGSKRHELYFILLKFKEFNYEKNEAVFELFLSDEKMKIKLIYLPEDEEDSDAQSRE